MDLQVSLYGSMVSEASFHNVYLTSTINELSNILGEPQCYENTGKDKVNVQWNCITDDGIKFTIYDWKEYRVLDLDESVEFHIGGKSSLDTNVALSKLLQMIKDEIQIDPRLNIAFEELKDIYTNED
ncbi:MAG: hypothetical protein ACFFKA_00205 [Candidatus Thorarchaeota archaeon]